MNQAEREHARQLAAYDQNSQSFRALNQLMWQIPLLSMSLTGGLWFGVAKAETSPFFQMGLLFLAGAGNIVLIIVVHRLRYIMDEYLIWLEKFDASGFVAAKGQGRWDKPLVVRGAFQTMFTLAALISFGLMVPTARDAKWFRPSSVRSEAFYDRSAIDLVDRYEAIDFVQAHPYLVSTLTDKPAKRILDIGAGTGRDAAAMAALGHHVTAVEPSDRMRGLGRTVHGDTSVQWLDASLPRLQTAKLAGRQFDLIVLSAVWMHIHPSHRREALERLDELLAPGGEIYLTLRSGPADPDRAMYLVSPEELAGLAPLVGLTYRALDEKADLLGRAEIRWKSIVLAKPLGPERKRPPSHPHH